MKKYEKKDLIEGEIYYYEYDNRDHYISKFKTNSPYLNLDKSTGIIVFKSTGTLGWYGDNIRIATPEESHWLKECEKANKFISKEEALKSFNKQPEFIVGKWYKNIGNSGMIAKFKEIKENAFASDGFYVDEDKNYRTRHNTSFRLSENYKNAIECTLEEIQQYLPEGHVDKLYKSGTDPIELASLPEKWCIILTSENRDIVLKWCSFSFNCTSKYITYKQEHGDSDIGRYTQITFDQFKKWVLKEEVKQEPKSLVGRYVKILQNRVACSNTIKDEYYKIVKETGNSYYLNVKSGGGNAIWKNQDQWKNQIELMPEGFEPNKVETEEQWIPMVGEWVIFNNNSIRQNMTTGKLYKVLEYREITKVILIIHDKGNESYIGIENFRKALQHEIPLELSANPSFISIPKVFSRLLCNVDDKFSPSDFISRFDHKEELEELAIISVNRKKKSKLITIND